ncbi:hypothetical protein QBC34DRAFT_391014 [Podospora aff. communis PSN243]|uniref:F-box domain-containing protein n=1 Tax=Podospora aff. communis PSN243 TaxID=3040156 RepID=A0AAV9H2H1_9PEZI|nr:hypothetical protein QBC34DRAFT_391014 [Podospora aff. communis PSN243]
MRSSSTPALGDEPPLVDLTQPLPVKSKRTERLRKKLQKKSPAKLVDARGFGDLPYELTMAIFQFLRPQDLLTLCCVSKGFRTLILAEEHYICNRIIEIRYPILARCLQRPALTENLDEPVRQALQSPLRPETQIIYQHVQQPDMALVCTCMTCLLRWNSLCLALDFAHWQDDLDTGKPLPIIPRGTRPAWNRDLLARNAATVRKSLTSPLWYIRILEIHLGAIIRSVRRHGQNKGNQRRRFVMTEEDARNETDVFLESRGPQTVDFPFSRDNYYMLEAYLPNRSWSADRDRWIYLIGNGHDDDIRSVLQWEAFFKKRAERRALEKAERELQELTLLVKST